MRRNRHRSRNPLFAKRWFSDDVILVSVTWYLRFKLSYRDLAQTMGQRGVTITPCTILRWVIRYSTELPTGGGISRGRGALLALR